MKKLERLIHHWKYPYLSVLLLSIVITVYLMGDPGFKSWVYHLGNIGYLGVLIAGLLFTSSFTVPISIGLIAVLSEVINPVTLALVGALGSAVGDYILFRLIKDRLGQEVIDIVGKKETKHISHFLRLRYIAWSLPIIGALAIASPLPDEVGISLLGISKISTWKFLLISYVSNAFGILAIASVARVI
jgi:hypothetical protein